MMHFMGTILVLKLKFCVPWVLVALLRGVLALRPVHRPWLEQLVIALSGNLVIPLFVAFVVGVTTIAITVILPLEVGTTVLLRPFVETVVTSVTLLRHVAHLLIIPPAKLVTHLASDALLDLVFAFLCQGSICNLSVEDVLEVLSKQLKRLLKKMSAAFNVLGPVFLVERHIEPLKLQRLIGRMHVSRWEGFCPPNHLFESLKMFHGGLHHRLLENIVSTGL